MSKTKRRSRNIASKPKSRPNGFVSQNTHPPASEQRSDLAANSSPGPWPRATDPGFVPPCPEAAFGFFPQNGEQRSDLAANLSPDPGPRTTDPGSASPTPEAGAKRSASNRQNAQHSTGPRTAEGKAASSQNALKHGLSLQRHAVLPDEDPAAYHQLLAELREIYEPHSRREDLAVEDIAQCRWAIQRCDEAEATYLTRLTNQANDPSDGSGFTDILTPGQALGYAACLLIETDHRHRRYVEPDADYPALGKIHRYRTWWDRRLQRALAELDRSTRARHAEAHHQRQQEDTARNAELHQFRLAEAQAKIAQDQEKLAREQAKTTDQQARHAARKSKAEGDSLFDALERILSATPNGFRHWPGAKPNNHSTAEPPNGFVPQNPMATEETARATHGE